ncbi:MAG TPA: inositol 2-dehydrogenase, partial [Arachnia sp.]|nr:inositol 2-dehydrogenase [Arachnia sp.]
GRARGGDGGWYHRAEMADRHNRLTMDHNQRFGAAFTTEVQQWISAVSEDRHTGSSSWDGYAAAVVCDAGVQALTAEGEVSIGMMDKPALYA